MEKKSLPSSVFAMRLKFARKLAGLTQEKLGILAGIDEFSASARINQYERGVHAPEYGTAVRLAKALIVPVGYLYEADEKLAEIFLAIGKLSTKDRNKVAMLLEATDNPSLRKN